MRPLEQDPVGTGRPMTPEQALRVARTIALALPGGVVLLWAVGWFLTQSGTAPWAPEAFDQRMAAYAWVAVALAGFAGALFFRNRAVAIADAARGDERGAAAVVGAVQTNLLIAWALLENPGLLGGIIYLYLGLDPVLLYALPIYVAGVVLTFPRAAWYGMDPRRA